jgi:Ca2+-binding RTX toxin-like protein
MSKYVKNQDSNSAWMIDESDQTWTLGESATISVAGTAAIDIAAGFDNNLVRLKGDLVATGAGSEGVRMEGDETRLKIAKSSSIEANDGIRNTGFGNDIVNAGIVDGVAHGIYSDTGMDIRNRGEISGEAAIISAGPNYLENLKTGLIRADEVGIRLAGDGGSTIVNHGKIRSDDVAITVGGTSATQLINTGKIVGDVWLGGGHDTIDTRSGRINGVVDGGAGNDNYYVGKNAPQLTEKIDNGWDAVYSTRSITLAANFEELTLLGKKSINGTGNEGHNEIYGNAGANSMHGKGGNDSVGGGRGDDNLRGGAGADEFVFHDGDARDVIRDFEVGQDQVALLDFGFDDFADAVSLMSQHGDDTWISLGGGDRVVLKNVDMDDLSEEMVIFEQLGVEAVM